MLAVVTTLDGIVAIAAAVAVFRQRVILEARKCYLINLQILRTNHLGKYLTDK